MSSIYVPSPTEHGSYVLPSDGDPAVAESVNQSLRDLADTGLRANDIADSALALAAQAINGTTGGSYAPAAPIVITTSGIELNGVGANLNVNGASAIEVLGSFSVNTGAWGFSTPGSFSGAVAFTSTADFQQMTAIEAGVRNLSISGDTSVGNSIADELNVEATSTFESPVTFQSTETHEGIASFDNNVNINDDAQLGSGSGSAIQVLGQLFLHSRLRYDDTGRVPYKTPVLLPNASATVALADGEVFVIPYTINATRTYTLSNSGASPGDKMLFVTAINNGLVSIASIQGVQGIQFGAGSSNVYAEFIYLDSSVGAAGTDGWYPMVKAFV